MKPVESTEPNWEMSHYDWLAILGASLGAFMAILDIQITNASVREIQGALGLDFSESGWISTSYLIAEIIIIPLTAFLSKVFGMRRYILFNAFFFIISSLLCGMAWNLQSLIAARLLQGFSGGTLIPMAFQAMLLYMPPHRKNVGLAIFGMIATLAPTLGPSVGGWLTDTYGWRSIFFINIIPGILMMLAIRFGMPQAQMVLSRLKKIDYWGTTALILGLGSLTYLLEDGAKVEWFEDRTIQICLLISLIMIPTFIAIQIKSKNPLLKLNLLAQRNFGFSALVTMLAAVALYGGVYALSLYLGQIQGYSAQSIGQVMMWVGIPQLFIMPFIPYLLKKVDARILSIIGLSLFAYSNYLNAQLNSDFGGDQFKFSLIIRALGQPLFVIPLSAIGMATITPSEVGNASSIYNVLRNLGGSIGIALTGTFTLNREGFHFNRNIENISAIDSTVAEKLKSIQYLFMSKGLGFSESKVESLRMLVGLTHRESLIQAFGDIFLLLCLCLLVCMCCVVFLKKVKNLGSGGAAH